MINDDVRGCKLCNSPNIRKYGTYNDTQLYFCNDCQRKFKGDDSLFHSKVSAKEISSTLSMYYSGMSLNDIRAFLKQEHGYYPSSSSVYEWIQKYSDRAVEYFKNFTPKVGNVWIADETVINLDGKDVWLWDIIDADTRFLLATKLSYTRTTADAKTLMGLAYNKAGKFPVVVLTDKQRSYPDAIADIFGKNTEHKQTRPFVHEDSTNLIERWHGTLKERTKVMRGLKDVESALAFTDGFLVFYNFIRPHESLDGKTPAEQAGIVYTPKNWADVSRVTDDETDRLVRPYVPMPEMEMGRQIIGGKPYKAGRKRKPKTQNTRRQSPPQMSIG